jgi:hypothetical protein
MQNVGHAHWELTLGPRSPIGYKRGRGGELPAPSAQLPWRRYAGPGTFRDSPMSHKHPASHVFYRKLTREYPQIVRGDGCYLHDDTGRYLDEVL